MTGAYIGMLAMLILIYVMHLFQARAYRKIVNEGYEYLDRQSDLFDQATQHLLSITFTRVAQEHFRYKFDDESLPGLVAVKCLGCNEMVGTMELSDGEVGDPSSLVKGHVEEVFREQIGHGREAAKSFMDEVKADAEASAK